LEVVYRILDKHWRQFPHLSRKAFNILLPFAISYLCGTGFSAVVPMKTKYFSTMGLENDLRTAISKL
jgi:hypothetical protein